jgi:hypothetical protein
VEDVPRADLLAVLACEIERRPRAPGIGELAPHVREVAREPGALAVRFAPEARAVVEAFAAAERECCAGIGWQLSEGPEVVLRVEAGAAALDALADMFRSGI